MLKNKEPSPIRYILVTLALLVGGYIWFFLLGEVDSSLTTNAPTKPSPTVVNSPKIAAPPITVPAGTKINIDGSTSMVTINQNLKKAFEGQFSGTSVSIQANGSDRGIQNLLDGKADIAAISRPLTAQEQAQGLQAVAIASDAIALVVGINNSFSGGLTSAQVEAIFQGTITNWSVVGGAAQNLRVINRPPISGTHQVFKELVLKNANFGTTSNFTTLSTDATTPLLRALGNDGIGYATYTQVVNQKTVRTIAINGVLPDSTNYPYKRTLFYAYKNPASPGVKALLNYAASPPGKQAISSEN